MTEEWAAHEDRVVYRRVMMVTGSTTRFWLLMQLIDVLKRCREHSNASQDAFWAARSGPEIVAVLDRGIEAIEHGKEVNRDELRLLFAPTGDLQETSIANGWAEEYLSLSARFDDRIAELKGIT